MLFAVRFFSEIHYYLLTDLFASKNQTRKIITRKNHTAHYHYPAL